MGLLLTFTGIKWLVAWNALSNETVVIVETSPMIPDKYDRQV